ncbi:MAG TPA: hypothetical protein VJN02_07890 [Gammaproteobacteria bacterium]|nr:hypothetical protein [Gammaproteobacteria bacterium]
MKKINITAQVGHQGDVQWFSIDSIPCDAKQIEKQFLAASERSGSFHALFGNYNMFEVEGGFCIEAKEDCILNHSLQAHLAGKSLADLVELPKKDHRHSIIKKGKYFVGIQQRFDPMSAMKEKVVE